MNTYIEPELEIKIIKEMNKGEHFEPITIEQVLTSEDDYVIVGEAGIGKSSLLDQIAVRVLNGTATNIFPIFIELKDIEDIRTKQSFIELLSNYRKYNLGEYDLENIKILFLLDGLDQVKEYGNIKKMLKYKDVFFNNKNRFILTTRPVGYNWIDDLKEFKELRIMPFNEERIREYIGEDYKDSKLEELLYINKELLQIPILLKMVKQLIKKDNIKKVKNRTQLYKYFINYLFEEWERGKKNTCGIDDKFIQDDMAAISYVAINKRELGYFNVHTAINYFKDKEQLNTLIDWSITHNLIESRNIVSYTHQTYQEYFASLKLKEKILDGSTINKKSVMEHLEYYCWDEVWKFVIGGLEDKGHAEELINEIGKHDIYLAALCIIGTNLDMEYEEDFKYKVLDYLINRDVRFDTDKKISLILNQLKLIFRSEIEMEKVLNIFVFLLKNRSGVIQWSAFEALGEIGSEKAVEFLIALIKDKDEEVHFWGVEALVKIGSEKAVEPLIALIRDKNETSDVRESAVEALWRIGSEKAVEPLIALISDENETSDVRQAAAEVLGGIGSEKAVEPLIALISDENETSDVRQAAVKALGGIGSEKAVEPLIALIKDEGWGFPTWAAKVLGKIKSENAVEPQWVADALGEIGSEKAAESLIALIKDENETSDVRWRATEALGKIKSEKTVEPLIALLKDEIWDDRRLATNALVEIKTEKAVESLIALLKDENEASDVRKLAAEALGKIKPEKAVEPLIALLKNKDSGIRWRATEALGEIKSEQAVEPLIALLKDENKGSNVFRSAAEALWKIKPEKAIEPLIALLKNNSSYGCELAAKALGEIKSEQAVEPLIELLKDEYQFSDVLRSATEALGEIKSEQAVEPLIALLKNKNLDVRKSVIETLGKIKSEQAVKPLIALLKNKNSDITGRAAEALGEIKSEQAVKPLIALLKNKNSIVYWRAANALGDIMVNLSEDLQNGIIRKIMSTTKDTRGLKNIKNKLGRRFIKLLSPY